MKAVVNKGKQVVVHAVYDHIKGFFKILLPDIIKKNLFIIQAVVYFLSEYAVCIIFLHIRYSFCGKMGDTQCGITTSRYAGKVVYDHCPAEAQIGKARNAFNFLDLPG